jgi:toxin-antitoxin system PIN domain toxin
MLCVDVNVLVDAFRPTAHRHDQVKAWLDDAAVGTEPVIVLPGVAASFLRVVTNRRIWQQPSSPATSTAFLRALGDAPAVRRLEPTPGHVERFLGLVDHYGLTGDDVPDAYLVACCLDLGATLVTSDRGLRRFPGVTVREPIPAT